MTTTDNKLDSAMLAQEDIGSSFTNWEVPEIKPGEKKTFKFYQKKKRALDKEIEQLQDELDVSKLAHQNALEFEATETSNRKNYEAEILRLQSEIEKQEEQLNTRLERRERLDKAIKQHLSRHSDLKDRQPVAENREQQKQTTTWINGLLRVLFRQVLPGVLLILFCAFDAKNMYDNLNNYNNDTAKHTFIAAIIFAVVLFTSFGVKMKNTLTFWIAFLAFLALANVPQFLGRDPKIGLSNLTSSPEHMIVFAISFGGSILVTLLNLALKEKRKEPADVATTPSEPIETPAARTLKNLYREFDAVDVSISTIMNKVAELKNILQQRIKYAEQETASKTTEKVEAIKSIIEQQNQITGKIENIRTQIEDLQDACTASIEKYRQEVSIHQLIHDYPETINYIDIKSITI